MAGHPAHILAWTFEMYPSRLFFWFHYTRLRRSFLLFSLVQKIKEFSSSSFSFICLYTRYGKFGWDALSYSFVKLHISLSFSFLGYVIIIIQPRLIIIKINNKRILNTKFQCLDTWYNKRLYLFIYIFIYLLLGKSHIPSVWRVCVR